MSYRIETSSDGTKKYYRDDRLHRDGGLPAIECSDGCKFWLVNGEQHRDGGLPAIEYSNGHKEWFVNGKLHRDGGLPAVEYPYSDGDKEWLVRYNYDRLHCDGGLPAVTCSDVWKEWWVNGIEVSEEQAKLLDRIKMKRVKRVYWKWYDITYRTDKPAFKARMNRDMDTLENDIGYQLN